MNVLAENNEALSSLVTSGTIIPLFSIAVGLIIAVTWIIAATIHYTVVGKTREQTKREMAAYVAEGTIDADKAVAILNAGNQPEIEIVAGGNNYGIQFGKPAKPAQAAS